MWSRFSWFKFNNLALALGMTLKFYASVTKRLKLKVTKFSRLIPTFVEVSGEKPVGEPIPPYFIKLNAMMKQVRKIYQKYRLYLYLCYTFCIHFELYQWWRSTVMFWGKRGLWKELQFATLNCVTLDMDYNDKCTSEHCNKSVYY